MTGGQHIAVDQLHAVERAGGGALEILSVTHPPDSEFVTARVSISCAHHEHAPGGLPLEDREEFTIYIPSDFPFTPPSISTAHTRFAGSAHVTWQRWLCLYQAPATEWDPSDGMYGFLERLDIWLDHAARGELDPTGAPLHPPVTYRIPGSVRRSIVVRANTPPVGPDPWIGLARLRVVSESRVDLVGWQSFDAAEWGDGPAAAILLADALPPEFPTKVRSLIEHLGARGVPVRRLLLVLKIAAMLNDDDRPLYVVIGAPMRGIRGSGGLRQHLAAWSITPVIAKGLRLAIQAAGLGEVGQEIRQEVEDIILSWAEEAQVDWCNVMEDRPEIVERRDYEAPTRWFAGRTVALWGCGALGGPIAEYLTRAGVMKLILHDNKVVTPGLLVRQLFDDHDVGRPKARALADRLLRIRPDLDVAVDVSDLLESSLGTDDWTDGADLIIDTTGSSSVLAKLEFVRWTAKVRPISVASMVIGHRADRGFAAVAPANHTGGPADVCRRAKLATLAKATFRAHADEFWPERRRPIFQPEPGCSEPTFVGGAADCGSLAGVMLNAVARELQRGTREPTAHFVGSSVVGGPDRQMVETLRWDPDRVSEDPHSGYQVRIAESAWREVMAWVERGKRIAGPKIETGGYLFGERDDAARIIWVSDASGPPPDSEASEHGFLCGVMGVSERNATTRRRTRESVRAIGVWHAHPTDVPMPSLTDVRGMAAILDNSESPAARSLLLIVGHTTAPRPLYGTFEFTRADIERVSSGAFRRTCAMQAASRQPRPRRVGLALSGGGARAIAFHLGCLRALHDRGVLGQIDVMSLVSGGSVIGALYAYSAGSFEDFDARVVKLLRRGLTKDIARVMLSPKRLLGILSTVATAGVAAKGADAIRLLTGLLGRGTDWLARLQPPLRRRVSRTDLFERALRDDLFGDKLVSSARRGGVNVVINACELRTGSAFRFGSRESGCWRFGRLQSNDVPIALAVAASAAYPVLLPALDREFVFDRGGDAQRARVLLTDGGIFDNLGVTPLEPGRSEVFSSNVYSLDYIICCDAGAGLLGDETIPYWWPSRMIRSFETVFRKVQNGAYQRLHAHVVSGAMKGFVLSYLGQQDDRLPWRPPDLVSRETVSHYPTDFAPMAAENIEKLSRRGEILTRMLINEYCPEL